MAPEDRIDVRVLRLCSVYEAPPESIVRSSDLDPVGGMQVHTARLTSALDALGVAQTVLTARRRAAPRAELVGERSVVIRSGVAIRWFRQLYGLASVPEVLRIRDVDLVHVHLGEDIAAPALAWLAATRARVPLVATIHCSVGATLQTHDVRSAVVRALGRPGHDRVMRSARALFTLSEATSEHLVSSGVPRSRIRSLPFGIDLPTDPDGAGTVPVDRRRTVLFVGRLVREKGVLDLIAAFERLRTTDADLVIVGDGPLRRRVRAASRGLPRGRIRAIGSIPHARVPDVLRRARVVVVPSWFEERGRVVLESLAEGVPVIAAKVGGIRETIRDGENGVLVPARRPDALAEALDRVLTDDALVRSMSAAGPPGVADQSLERMAAVTIETYREVLGRARPELEVVA